MAQSETSGSESFRESSTPTRAEAGGAVYSTGSRKERGTRRLPSSIVSAPERERLIKQARDTEFPVALRGYDRAAVDRYVEHVNRLLAELEISSSPESAVRHALDEVSEETRDILQHAHDTADEITARSRSRADDRLQQAEQEANELRAAALTEAQETKDAANRDAEELRATARGESADMLETAETRKRDLARSAEAIWRERRRLLDDMRGIGEQLVAIGDVEGKRFAKLSDEIPVAAAHNGEPAATT
jgi:DivIVA domain-containing protein